MPEPALPRSGRGPEERPHDYRRWRTDRGCDLGPDAHRAAQHQFLGTGSRALPFPEIAEIAARLHRRVRHRYATGRTRSRTLRLENRTGDLHPGGERATRVRITRGLPGQTAPY